MQILIITILWLSFGALAITQYAPCAKGLSTKRQIALVLICLVGGPIFGMGQILEEILNVILPGGWNDDDNFKF